MAPAQERVKPQTSVIMDKNAFILNAKLSFLLFFFFLLFSLKKETDI